MNATESDLKNAIKHNPAWIELWSRSGGREPPLSRLGSDLLRRAYNEAWNAGRQAGEAKGYRQAEIEGGDPGCRFGL